MNINKEKLNIRTAQQIDWERIIDIYNQAIREGDKTADTELQTVEGRKDWLSQHLNEKHPILLAEIDSKIVGWCSLSPYRSGRKALSKTLEISYYVDFNYRNKKIATKLLNETIGLAIENGTKALIAILLDINSSSIALLEKFKFQKWGHLPNIAEINKESYGQYIYGKHI